MNGRVLLVTEQVGVGGKRSHVEALQSGLTEIGWGATLVDRTSLSRAERALLGGPHRLIEAVARGRGHFWSVPVAHRLYGRRIRSAGAGSDLIHVHEATSFEAARRVASGRPLVLTVHGPLSSEVASAYRLAADHPAVQYLRAIEASAFVGSDAVISVDRAHAEYVRALGRRAHVDVITNFVDMRRFHPGTPPIEPPHDLAAWLGGRRVLLCPRRLVPKNGVDVAVRAMGELVRRGEPAALVIAGGGPDREMLSALADQIGARAGVWFAGEVATAEMPRWVAWADMVLVPSVPSQGVEEATSIAVLEAQACGQPVIASALGGILEIIADGVTGLLVPPGDARALADAIARVLADRALALHLGEAATHEVELRHSHRAGAREVANVYERVLAARTGRRESAHA